MTLNCLQFSRAKILKEWRETDYKITFCYNEAKDNAKFIQALEKNCHSLYLDDPVKMQDSILGLLQTVRLVHSVSQFYNTSERTSALMVKVHFYTYSIYISTFSPTSVSDHEPNDWDVQRVHNLQRQRNDLVSGSGSRQVQTNSLHHVKQRLQKNLRYSQEPTVSAGPGTV